MRLSLFTILCLLSVLLFAQTGYQPVSGFDPDRNPSKDLQNTITEASKTHKNIILDVGGEWCIWCHRIDSFIQSSEDITNYIQKNYILMKVNFSPENKNEEFLSKYPKIEGYPHFFVLDENGKLLHSQDTGLLEEAKSYGLKKFMAFLKEWAPKQN
jgi:thioredoxin-related protein